MRDVRHIGADPFASQGERIGDRPRVHDVMRRAGAVVRVEAPAGGPAWIVTDDAVAREVLTDERFAKDPALAPAHWHGRDAGLEPPASEVRSLTTVDGAEHRRLRRVHTPAFARRRLLEGRERIARIARDLLGGLREETARTGRPADLVADFAPRYPLMVICDMLGVPLTDLDRATGASRAMVEGAAEKAWVGMAQLEEMVRASRAEPGRAEGLADILADGARAELGGVTDREVLHMIAGLIFAGQITTQSFLGPLVAHQLAGDLGDGDADAFVAEALRLHPPVPFTLWRFTTTPVEIAGVPLPAGAPVLVDIEGVNTDPARHPDPYELKPDRSRGGDLTFGHGPHFCLGAQLAQLEARVVVEVMRDDFPHARLAVPFDELERDRPGTQSRGLAALPVWLDGEPGA